MSLDLTRNTSLVKRFSTAKVWIAEYTKKDGVPTIGTWELLPYITAPKIKTNEETSELRDGSNAVIYNDSTLLNYELSFEILQADDAALNMAEKARGQQYILLFKVGKVGDKIQYQFYGPGQISSQNETDYSDFVKVAFTYKTVIDDDNIKITSFPADTKIKEGDTKEPTLASISITGVTISAGDHRKIVPLEYLP
jgi:hypothetical protein